MDAPPIQQYWPPTGHPLEPYLLSIFRIRTDQPPRHEIILPKGNVDLLFNLGDCVHGEGLVAEPYVVRPGSAWVGGLKTRPYRVLAQGGMYLVGISLRAEACAGLLPLSPAEIVNREAHDLPSTAGMRTMAEQLHDADTFANQCALLVRWLQSRLRPPRGAEAVRHACTLLRSGPAQDAVGAAAKALCVSPRHLRRLVNEHVGIGPAEYVRLARFIDAMHRMAAPGRTLTKVAHAAGYYDQAHFNRDFRAFAGMTPQEYRTRANGPTVGHIVTQ
jgi:AraC-like DNA-binding protein